MLLNRHSSHSAFLTGPASSPTESGPPPASQSPPTQHQHHQHHQRHQQLRYPNPRHRINLPTTSYPAAPIPMLPTILRAPGRFFHHVKSIAKQYGLAWLLVSQILSWSNLLLIYLFLRAAQPDVTGFVKNYNLGHYAETVAETGGTFALAVLCNKVLSPLRFFVCLVIVRRTAGRLNPWLERKWAGWKRWRGTDVEAVPREDPEEVKQV